MQTKKCHFKIKVKQGKGTTDHLMPLGYLFFNKDQQKSFEAGMFLGYFQINAQMFIKCPYNLFDVVIS